MQTDLILPINKTEIMNNVASLYHRAFKSSSIANKYLSKLGITDEGIYARFRIGYADGSLQKLIMKNEELKYALNELGLLNSNGKEFFFGYCILPVFDLDGNCVQMYAITPDVLNLPGLDTEFLNQEALAEYFDIILTESIIDFLLIFQIGYKNVMPVSNILLNEHIKKFSQQKIEKVYLAFSSGKEKANKIKRISECFYQEDIACYNIEFPDNSGINEYLNNHGPDKFKELLDQAEQIKVMSGKCMIAIAKDEAEFVFGDRVYVVKDLNKEDTLRLKVNIRAKQRESNGKFHIDTLDLYVSRNRSSFINAACRLFGVSYSKIDQDLCKIIEKLEKTRLIADRGEKKETEYHMTEYEKEEALELLNDPDMLDRVAKDLDICGYVGEEINKKIGYLISISRKLNDPLSGVIMSGSGAGKSKLMEHLASFVPEEEVIWYTRITPQALYYNQEKSLKHKLLITCEEEGLFGADYSIRELISSKILRMASPVKDPVTGRMKTVEYEVEGPISLLFSTTSGSINYENATRCFILFLDESDNQTKKIQESQRISKTLDGLGKIFEIETKKRIHQNAQRMLKPLAVVNPFATKLEFPYKRLRTRRDHEKYLSLIESITFLFQYQREIKLKECNGRKYEYIEVTKQDLQIANDLMAEIVGHNLDELSKSAKKLLKMIWKMIEEKCDRNQINYADCKFNRRDVREYIGWSDDQIKAHIKQLEELEYLIVVTGKRGKMYKYELAYPPEKNNKKITGLVNIKKLDK